MKVIGLFSLIFLIQFSSLCQQNAESREIMKNFRQHEMQSWNEASLRSETYRGDDRIDVKFYHLDIEIAIDSAYILGNVLCRFTPTIEGLDELSLDLNQNLIVTDIGFPCDSYYQDGDQIIISLNQSYNPGDLVDILITYHGKPKLAGGYKGLRYETHGNNEPIIATLSTPFLAHYWYPCKDGPEDKADSAYIDITIDNKIINGIELMAVSNGVLEQSGINGDKKTFSWRHRYPIVTYYIMAAVSNFVHFEDELEYDSGETLQLDYYVFNEGLVEQQQGVIKLPEAIEFFNGKYGNYPFLEEKYGMTQLGYYGAIENQTNTITNNMKNSWFMVSVHELAHMWFGDMITCKTWNHAWINEGFATYSEALWVENDTGDEAYKSYMNDLKYFQGGSVYLENPLDTFNVFTQIIYNKGAWVLHMLRGVVGDSLFFESVNNYSLDTSFRYKTAVTEDVQSVFETICNTDLDYFFEQWIYDEYYPTYHYNFIQESSSLFITFYQAQQELYGRRAVFEMPVDLKIAFTDNTDSTITLWNDEQLQNFEFNLDKEVLNVVIDPGGWILGKAYHKNDLPVSVNDNLLLNSDISIHPNPVRNTLYFNNLNSKNLPLRFTLYDLNGKKIMNQIIYEEKAHIKLENLEKGLYLYSLTSDNNQKPINGKIIKE